MVGILMDGRVHELVVVGEVFAVENDFPGSRFVESIDLFARLSGKDNGKIFVRFPDSKQPFLDLVLVHLLIPQKLTFLPGSFGQHLKALLEKVLINGKGLTDA